MLELVCYLLAMVLLGLAAILPDGMPHRDRIAYAGLCAFVIPAFVHAVHAH
ncbi:hypothetical protein QMK19_03605 [Streptomyces sp. H10-C2]|uniref:hypothetical protein n=1 Tax=unclassified Streptomyces TaxID=2593676 RepID=UPI0024B91119|nr:MULTISPECIES: hypothetical protein [unclassified Streptomyces]MDJ0342273.1 hypothetical protein [Streptomyces sp. PH10-H1]MDJ0368787.1 hypothetical protein [Streptomyces sp. H10-C2]